MRIAMVGLRGLPAYKGCILALELPESPAVWSDCGLYFKGGGVDELYALICRYLRSDRDRFLEGLLRVAGKECANRRSDPELRYDRL
jgi:hypothetical protein